MCLHPRPVPRGSGLPAVWPTELRGCSAVGRKCSSVLAAVGVSSGCCLRRKPICFLTLSHVFKKATI